VNPGVGLDDGDVMFMTDWTGARADFGCFGIKYHQNNADDGTMVESEPGRDVFRAVQTLRRRKKTRGELAGA